jgi:hypothetical protein
MERPIQMMVSTALTSWTVSEKRFITTGSEGGKREEGRRENTKGRAGRPARPLCLPERHQWLDGAQRLSAGAELAWKPGGGPEPEPDGEPGQPS